MRPATIGLLLVGTLAVGCSQADTDPSKTSDVGSSVAGRCVTALSGNRFCDEGYSGFDTASAYDNARWVCGSLSVKAIAKEWKTAKDPVSAARGYASDYEGTSVQAAFEGCLDGFADSG